MKTRIAPDGFLELPAFNFSDRAPNVPHRRWDLASHDLPGGCTAYVCANHKGVMHWVRVVGPGFAGDRSRRSATVVTRNAAEAERWIAAVRLGKVRVVEEQE